MTASRPYAPDDVFVFFVPLATVLLADVPATVFFAIAVVYLPVPLRRHLEACGASRWVANLAATVVAAVSVDVMSTPLAIILFPRPSNILKLAALLPDVVTTGFLGMVETVTLDDAVAVGLGLPRSISCTVATAASVIPIKLTLFDSLMFALLLSGDAVGRMFPALISADYRGAATALNERARETLFAIYVLQAAAAVGMSATGLAVLWALGYDYVVTPTTVTAVLQFIPTVGSDVLLAAMTVYHVVVDDVVAAVLVVTLLAESVDLLDTGLRVDSVSGDGNERNKSADDSVGPSQP